MPGKAPFYSQQHIKDATNLPVILFDLMYPMFQFMVEQEGKDKTLVVYGGTFSRRMDIDLARLLRNKGLKNVVVLEDYASWPKVFPLQEKAATTPGSLDLGFAGFLEWLPVSIFLLMLIPSIRRSPYLSVFCRVLLAAIFISFALSKIMRPAVFALNVVDYNLTPAWGSEPLGSRLAVGRTGGRVVPGPGHPHPGRGHAYRRHERHLYCGTGQRHSASHAH